MLAMGADILVSRILDKTQREYI